MFKYDWKKKIVAVTPMVSLLVFLALGFIWGIWNQAWLVFIAIPVMPFLVGLQKFKVTFVALVFIAFIVLGIFGYWHPGWLVFLLIPIYYTLFPGINLNKKKDTSNQRKNVIDAESDN